MLPQEIIRRKRDGHELSQGEIAAFIEGVTSGEIVDAQIGAFAMAVVLKGMTTAETVALTRAMTASGARLAWPDVGGPVVDKHSTGGIGDKVSLILAPVLAACGAFVPMISGRGLGHTGGTLDKLDSIPGYRTRVDLDHFRRTVAGVGCAIVGQSAELAPADRRLYAIRDVSATVESQPLIVASILSKKLAAGLDALVMDVKVGSGAFLPEEAQARDLARALIATAQGAGLPCRAVLTDMSMCLGRTAGNALEVREAVDVLAGRPGDARLLEVTLALAGQLLAMVGAGDDAGEGRERAARALASGAAAERLERMVQALGGPPDLVAHPGRHLPAAAVQVPAHAARPGFVQRLDARALGLVVIGLGGGRRRPEDGIDHAVGLAEVAAVGEAVGPERPLAVVHGPTPEAAGAAADALRSVFEVGDGRPPALPLVRAILQGAMSPESS